MVNFFLKIFSKIWLFINNILRSFDNTQNSGYSGRKLTALFSVLSARHLCEGLEGTDRLYAVFGFMILGLLCLGIVTFEQIIKLKLNNETKKE